MEFIMNVVELKPYTKNLKILLVEDDVVVRETICTLFSKIFAQVDQAENGKDALEKIREANDTYDMIMTDINMPIMDGVELVGHIREFNKVIPILIMSAHNDAEYLIDLINRGVDGFLPKPLNLNIAGGVLYKMAVFATDHKIISEYHEELEHQNIALMNKTSELEKMNRILMRKIGNEVPLDYTQTAQETSSELSEEKPQDSAKIFYQSYLVDDAEELKELVDELENSMLLMFQNDTINVRYAGMTSQHLRRFGNVLFRYSVFGELSNSIFDLSNELQLKGEFLADQHDLAQRFLEDLIFVLQKYVVDVWFKKELSPNFYDASIINDVQSFLHLVRHDGIDTSVESALLF